jgi:hypothetical protein
VSAGAAKRLAVGLAALSFGMLITGYFFSVPSARRDTGGVFFAGVSLSFVIVFSGIGCLITARQPRNPMGWIFCGVALATGLASLAGGYAEHWVSGRQASESLGEAAIAYSNVGWIAFVLVPATFLLLLFPDGHLLSRPWRAVAWCAGIGMAVLLVAMVLSPGPIEDFPQIQNPYALDSPVVDLLEGLSGLLLFAALVGSPLSLVLRFRRSGAERRQQIKWLAWGGAVTATTFVVALVSYDVVGAVVANSAIMLSVLTLPLAAGVAILRYRLYDIDVVINRTLVYGALTATLALAYLGVVVLLQLALSPLTEQSDLAIAGSTLAVAALARPARARIQGLVDRRFYRRRYNAARTLAGFSVRLREEVDLDALGRDLRGVVADTMQPTHVSLWLRERSR